MLAGHLAQKLYQDTGVLFLILEMFRKQKIMFILRINFILQCSDI